MASAIDRGRGQPGRERADSRRSRFTFEVFRPDTVDLMRAACARLEAVPLVRDVYTDRHLAGLGKNYLTETNRQKALGAYRSYTRLYALLGLSPVAASNVVVLCGLAELFYHWNVKTPRWLGYIVQRPESHCVHHQEGLHWYNFADLPVWDFLFGTFCNPYDWQLRCGLGSDNEPRLGEMLKGRDLRTRAAARA